MDWQALMTGELPDSDLWLLSLFDAWSDAAQAHRDKHDFCCRLRLLMPVFMLFALAALVAVLRTLHATRPARFIPPAVIPPRLPAAGVMLTPRLLPVPLAVRRG